MSRLKDFRDNPPVYYTFNEDYTFTSTAEFNDFPSKQHYSEPYLTNGKYALKKDSLILADIVNQSNGEPISREAFKIYSMEDSTIILSKDPFSDYMEYGYFYTYEKFKEYPLLNQINELVAENLPEWTSWMDRNSIYIKQDSVSYHPYAGYTRRDQPYLLEYDEALFTVGVEPRWSQAKIDSLQLENEKLLSMLLESLSPWRTKEEHARNYQAYKTKMNDLLRAMNSEPIVHVGEYTITINRIRTTGISGWNYFRATYDVKDRVELINLLKNTFSK